ncbi:GNAT family N-acetyltransferase, partial [Treponema porcinum]|uniref:GNAT family N-acetyltransferase n=1 Tax=Treponema porcinum TaxID=261392 RepID=UPI0023F5275D
KYKMDMLRFIKAGALLHDIGKLGNTALINLHFRKITDKEYGRIKTHSLLGGEIVKGIPYLEIYRDFILGHHKFWNDEKGYPESFKVQDSAYKYYVGLITLADCIDSVTDAEGRNYATKKKFDDIFDELREGAGSRYCPELVDLLMRDENLLNQLRMLTSTGRNLNLRKTYLRFIEHNIHFSEQEEKTVSLLNDTLYKRLPDFYKTCYPSVESEKIVKYLDGFTSSRNGRMYIMHDKTNRIYGVMNGFITSSIDEPDYFYIKEFIMLPDFRRKGFGTKLLMAVSRLLKCEDVNNLKLNVQTGSPDEAFFWIDGFSKSKSYLMELGI